MSFFIQWIQEIAIYCSLSSNPRSFPSAMLTQYSVLFIISTLTLPPTTVISLCNLTMVSSRFLTTSVCVINVWCSDCIVRIISFFPNNCNFYTVIQNIAITIMRNFVLKNCLQWCPFTCKISLFITVIFNFILFLIIPKTIWYFIQTKGRVIRLKYCQ